MPADSPKHHVGRYYRPPLQLTSHSQTSGTNHCYKSRLVLHNPAPQESSPKLSCAGCHVITFMYQITWNLASRLETPPSITLPSTLSLSLAIPKRMHKLLPKPIDSSTNLTLILQSLAVFPADSPKHPVRWNLGLHSTISSSYLSGSQPASPVQSLHKKLHKLPALPETQLSTP